MPVLDIVIAQYLDSSYRGSLGQRPGTVLAGHRCEHTLFSSTHSRIWAPGPYVYSVFVEFRGNPLLCTPCYAPVSKFRLTGRKGLTIYTVT